jgi:hypothetical protein
MEFPDDESLAARIEKGAVPLSHALTIAIEIAGTLDTAHGAGIVHRSQIGVAVQRLSVGYRSSARSCARTTDAAT